MMMSTLNLNNSVKVKLTEHGHAELKRQHEEFNKEYQGVLGEYKPRTEDENGYVSFQLHDLMNTFGHMLLIGNTDMPFEKCEILIPGASLKQCN